jgi:hypothetical protein
MIVAATLCPAPPLLAPELTGQADVLPELHAACATAVAALLAAAPDVIVVVGPGELTATWSAEDRLNLAAYAPALALREPAPAPQNNSKKRAGADGQPALPLALGIGALLLDEAGYQGPTALWSIADCAPQSECARLGQDLTAPAERVGLLIMGDGTARRSVSAPGYLDDRAEPWDAEVERAIRAGDLTALAALDPVLATDLMATGRPAWQVLAAAFAGLPVETADTVAIRATVNVDDTGAVSVGVLTEVLYCDAPLGVGYLVATLQPGQ